MLALLSQALLTIAVLSYGICSIYLIYSKKALTPAQTGKLALAQCGIMGFVFLTQALPFLLQCHKPNVFAGHLTCWLLIFLWGLLVLLLAPRKSVHQALRLILGCIVPLAALVLVLPWLNAHIHIHQFDFFWYQLALVLQALYTACFLERHAL